MTNPEDSLDNLNRNIPLVSIVFLIFSTLYTILFMLSYLGLRNIGFILFVNNSDLVRIFLNILPFLILLIIVSVLTGWIAEHLGKGRGAIAKNVGHNVVPVAFFIIPAILFDYYSIKFGKRWQDLILPSLFLLGISLFSLLISVGIISQDRKNTPILTISALLIVAIPLYSLIGFLFSSLQTLGYWRCYKVYTKEIISGTREIKRTHLILSLDKGMAFDDGKTQLFINSENITSLESTSCN